MSSTHKGDLVLDRLIAWAQGDPQVRALVLESSRAADPGALDAFSDYDVLLIVSDLDAFVANEDWIAAYGTPMVRFNDSIDVLGFATVSRLVLYEDGVKIDYMLWPAALVRRVAGSSTLPDLLDWGYRVLLDKDGLTSGLPAPTRSAHIPSRPSTAEYRALVESFWWETTYIAKNLWRDELMHARYSLDVVLKHDVLLRMLQWRVEIDHDWSWKPGPAGRGLKQALSPDLWTALEATFAGPGIEENWTALFATTDLFRRAASDVAAALGYSYPEDLDRRVTAYLEHVRRAPH